MPARGLGGVKVDSPVYLGRSYHSFSRKRSTFRLWTSLSPLADTDNKLGTVPKNLKDTR
jgi:hypothetical protein